MCDGEMPSCRADIPCGRRILAGCWRSGLLASRSAGDSGSALSRMVTFELFVAPVLARLSGAAAAPRRVVSARLARNLASATGREDYVQVRLQRAEDGVVEAVPVFGKSNLIFTLIRADGMVKVPLD